MAERGVTRAAERLGRTQSAVSHSLSRLREQLGDPLLVKGGQFMLPTAFALEFMEQARPILRSIRRVLSPRYAFDPRTSQRVFRFAAPDFAVALFTSLLARVRDEAPGVSVEWAGLRDPMLLQIEEGQIDVAIAPTQLRLPQGVTGQTIGALTWRCFARRGHPAFRKWGPKAWSRWPHVVVRVGDSLASPVNAAARAAGLERTIGGWSAFLGDRTRAARLRSAGHAAVDRHARREQTVRAGVEAGSLSHRPATACNAVERLSRQRSRDCLATRSAEAHRAQQVCQPRKPIPCGCKRNMRQIDGRMIAGGSCRTQRWPERYLPRR